MAFGLGYQAVTFDTYDALSIRGNDTNLYLTHTCCANSAADRDLLHQVVSLHLHRKAAVMSLVYGVSDRLDVGVLVPFIEMAADARVQTRVLRIGTSADPSIHQYGIGSNGKEKGIDLAGRIFPSGEEPPESGLLGTGSSTARGIGDLIFRAKFAVMRSTSQAAAFAIDLQAPTGSTDEWLGLGVMQFRPALLWARTGGAVALRVKADALIAASAVDDEFSSTGVRPFELGFGVGFDTALAPRTRLTVDFLGRQVNDVPELTTGNTGGVGSLQVGDARSVTYFTLIPGARFHLSGSSAANLHVTIPMGARVGLRASPAVVFSIDKGF